MMTVLRVLNVGHGDSTVLLPRDDCQFSSASILVDVGPGDVDPLLHVGGEGFILLLSHAHMDHIGGLSWILGPGIQRLRQVWLPMYWDEICTITAFVLRLRGVDQVPSDDGSILSAKLALATSRLLGRLAAEFKVPIKGLSQGDKLCHHTAIFNPPLDPDQALGIPSGELDGFVSELDDTDFAEVRQWVGDEQFHELRNTILTEGWSHDSPAVLQGETGAPFQQRMRFVRGMIYKLRGPIRKFIERPTPSSFARIYSALRLASNEASVVFRYDHDECRVLFTGDAGKQTFGRLLQQRANLCAEVFKVPHHGSRRNVNRRILSRIMPRLAIVSHDNRRFGRASDSLPNQEVISLLDSFGIDVLYTNDVQKKGYRVKYKPSSSQFHRWIEYCDKR